jgi:hypothetical protein
VQILETIPPDRRVVCTRVLYASLNGAPATLTVLGGIYASQSAIVKDNPSAFAPAVPSED